MLHRDKLREWFLEAIIGGKNTNANYWRSHTREK
jgi:hypothetical protein